MTLSEARRHVGDGVVYHPGGELWRNPESGTIASVNDRWVFVRYHGDTGTRATAPDDLTLVTSR